MILTMRRTAVAVGLAVLSLASTAGHAASVAYEFKTFFDTSTAVTTDTKTLGYSVATLSFTDINGGVQVSLTQNNTLFPARTLFGTYLDSLWVNTPKATITPVSGTSPAPLLSFYKTITPEAGYTYPQNISFAQLLSPGISEGNTSVFKLTGVGVTVDAILNAKSGSIPMIDLTNVGSPYNTTFLSLGSGNVRFIGKIIPVPEPGTYALMGLGLVGLAAVARRRQA